MPPTIDGISLIGRGFIKLRLHNMEIPKETYVTATETKAPARQSSTLHSLTTTELKSYGLNTAWAAKNPTYDAFVRNYAPAWWTYALSEIGLEGVWSEETPHPCPSVGALDTIYGQGSAVRWVRTCLTSVGFGSAEKDKGMIQAMEDACPCLVETIRAYKVLEVMMFFAKLKGGAFKTYGKFDVKNIGETFVGQFVPQILKARSEATEANRKYRAKLADERFCFTKAEWDAYKAAKGDARYRVVFRYPKKMKYEAEWDRALLVRKRNVNGIREAIVDKDGFERAYTPAQAKGLILVMEIKPLNCPNCAPSAQPNTEDDKVTMGA